MSNKLFNEEEVLALKQSPYVESVSKRSVTFTPEFKQIAYDELCSGKNMKQIFEDYSIDTSTLGGIRIRGFQEKIEKMSFRSEGFANLRKQRSKKAEQTPEDKLECRVRQLEHELAYAKQEVEFLKKIQQADTEARKQWESKQSRK